MVYVWRACLRVLEDFVVAITAAKVKSTLSKWKLQYGARCMCNWFGKLMSMEPGFIWAGAADLSSLMRFDQPRRSVTVALLVRYRCIRCLIMISPGLLGVPPSGYHCPSSSHSAQLNHTNQPHHSTRQESANTMPFSSIHLALSESGQSDLHTLERSQT